MKPVMDIETAARAIAVVNSKHGRWLKDEAFSVSATRRDTTVFVSLSLTRHDRSFDYQMQAAISIDDKNVHNDEEALDLGLDFLDWYLAEFFKSHRELLLPLDWQPHRFGDHEILAKGDVRNPELDDMADAWLRGDRPAPSDKG